LLSSDLLLAQNVPPKAGTAGPPGTPGVAVDTNAPSGGATGSASSPLAGFMPLLMMAVIFVPFFLLMSRRQKKEAQARASLKKGDRVTCSGGLIGELVESDDRIAKIKIAPGVTVQYLASTIAPYVEAERAPAKELKEAKAVSEKK
jgi:preprotein translocase subunit YajC